MQYLRFKRYHGENGISQARTWYRAQTFEIRVFVYGTVDAVSQGEEPLEEFAPLPAPYAGLLEMPIFIPSPQGIVPVGLIGFMEPESPNFIVTIMHEMDDNNHAAYLQEALRYKTDWENHRGETDDLFTDEDLQEYL